jgi:HAD superfamily hydrolase (TIGR01484 family)
VGKQILFLDYDGTIVDEFDSSGLGVPHMLRFVPKETLEFFIDKISEASKLVLVSGRSVADMQAMILKSLEQAQIETPESEILLGGIEFIGNHGAEHGTIKTVRDLVSEKVDSKYFFDEIKSRLAKLNIELFLWTETEQDAVWSRVKEHGISVHYEDFVDLADKEWIGEAVERCIFEFLEENNNKRLKSSKEEFKKHPELRLQCGKGVIDILSSEANKGRAVDIRIQELKSEELYREANLIAAGNDVSDLSFLDIVLKYKGRAYFIGDRIEKSIKYIKLQSPTELIRQLASFEKSFV